MQDGTPARDFLLPRLKQLINDAGKKGISREVAVAVLIDLVTSGAFNKAKPDPRQDTTPGTPHDVPLADFETGMAERKQHPDNPLRGVNLLDRNFHPRGRGRGR